MKKKFLKIFSLILVVTLLLSTVYVSAFAEKKQINYLLLGDSIAEGFGIKNRSEASYGKIVADTNGYTYTNDARYARDSAGLIKQINTVESVKEHIKSADIISLSIGSNDYIASKNLPFYVIGALLNINDKQLDDVADNMYNNLCTIISMIKELNPDVVILMQNVYCTWSGFAEVVYKKVSDRVNSKIYKYIEEHPSEVTLCNISVAMQGHPEYLADDSVHPNAKGNVEIAKVVLKQLKDMGLGTETEPVVNVQGIDYDYYPEYFENEVFGKFITVLLKIVSGNAVNLFR